MRFQRAWYNTGLSYGTLVVHARTNQNDTGISSIQATWRDAGANLPYDQCVVTYTSNTSGGSTIQIWTKLQLRYDGYCYEKEVDDSRQSMTDNWTLYSYKNTEGETSLPTTQTVLQPSFGQQSLNQLTFYYDNFSTATSSSRYQKITFVTTDVEDSSMTSDRTIYIPKENGTMALVSDVEEVPAQEPAEEDVSEGSNAPTDPAASSDDDYWPYDMSDSLKKMKNEKAEAVSEDTAAAKSTTEGFSEKVIVAEENEEAVVSRESISAETENDTDKTDDSVKEKKKKKGIFHRMFSYDRE